MKQTCRGYTLVELIVAMLVFSIVMLLISVSFSTIVRRSGQLVKSAETDIGGLIGLELMRSDLELAGFGLHWSVTKETVINYSEAGDYSLVFSCPDGCPQAKPSRFDDSTYPKEPNFPRAYRIGNNVGHNGSDYLVLKGSALGTSQVSRSWCYLNYSSTGTVVKQPRGEAELKPGKGHRVIVVKTGVKAGSASRELVTNGSSFFLKFNEPLPNEFVPRDKGDSYLVYGVDEKGEKDQALSFPFNRADYYISRPQPKRISSSCADGTGILYKSVINQDGWHTDYPILDCVADMQVVLFWDTNGDEEIDYHSDLVEEAAGSAADFRDKLKEIRVYILAQQGKIDTGYSYPVSEQDRAILVGDAALKGPDSATLGKIWKASELAQTFGQGWRNYRWRLYTIVVQPKNL